MSCSVTVSADFESGERSVAENTGVGEDIGDPVAATDTDALTYTLGVGGDNTSFAIVETSGQLQTKAALDYETKSSYTVTVTATDTANQSVMIDVTITVTNVNEAPTLTGDVEVEHAEDDPGVVHTYAAEDPEGATIEWYLPTGMDSSHFSISNRGALSFSSPPDYESPADADGDSVYSVTVAAHDGTVCAGGCGGAYGDTLEVTVTVTNVNEAGTVTLSSPQPQVSIELSASLDDPDRVQGAAAWQWESSADRTTWTEISGATSAAYTPVAGDADRYLRATASYTDEHGPGKTARADTTSTVSALPQVSIEAGPSPVTEGAAAAFTLTRTGATTAELVVEVDVTESGSMLADNPPSTATFAIRDDTATLSLPTHDDSETEDPSDVTATISASAAYQVKADAASAEVKVLDDVARWVLSAGPAELTEGGAGAVTLAITNEVTFTTNQTITLSFSGTAATDDYAVYGTDKKLRSAYSLALQSGETNAGGVYVVSANDADAEPAETIVVAATHGTTAIGTQTITIKASPLRLELSSLALTGSGRDMYPAFDAGTLHYAVGCAADSAVALTLSAKDAATRLAVNGIQQPNRNAQVPLTGLAGGDDILITLSNSDGAATAYTVHCMADGEPEITAEKELGSATELITAYVGVVTGRDPNTNARIVGRTHVWILDGNGVPRFQRTVGTRATHFKTHRNTTYPYSYAVVSEDYSHYEIALLNADLEEVTRVETTAALAHTNGHDFVVTESGNYIFMAYEPTNRDFTAWNGYGPSGQSDQTYTTDQYTDDSVIEVVDPQLQQVLL